MSITILTPYRLFFITQSDVLFALMKDGRLLKIKKMPYFQTLSSDFKLSAGVYFDGENTHIITTPFGFQEIKSETLASLFGYFYYPNLNANRKIMAVVEADLLKPRPEGEVRIYHRKIKKWYLMHSFAAKMKPALLNECGDKLLFIDNQNQLVLFNQSAPDKLDIIAQNVQGYNISEGFMRVVYYNNEKIYIYSLIDKKIVGEFTFGYTSAVGFAYGANKVFFATARENQYAIYMADIRDLKPILLTQVDEPVSFISF